MWKYCANAFDKCCKAWNIDIIYVTCDIYRIMRTHGFYDNITLNKHAPLKKTRVKTQPHPWYNEDIKDDRLYRPVCERVWKHTGLQCARIAYEAQHLVNNLRTKIQNYRHKLEYADNKDMFGIVNSLIKPKTDSLSNFVSTEECCNKFAKTLIDQRE